MTQYFNAQGHPDPNGDFQFINGSLVLRDGRSTRGRSLQPGEHLDFNLYLMDSAAPPSPGARTDAMMSAVRSQPVLTADAQQAESNTAYAEMIDHLTSRWRTPASAIEAEEPDGSVSTADTSSDDPAAAFRAMCRDLESSWRRRA